MKLKHHVFSPRTTEKRLKLIHRSRFERNVSQNELVMRALYRLDREMMALTRGIVQLR